MCKIGWTFSSYSQTISTVNYQKTTTSLGEVSYRTLGNGSRKILFYHGFPGSSAQIEIFKSEVNNLDLEVLCFDRPGYNETSINTSDAIAGTKQLTKELILKMGWTTFEVVTVSGGTPFGISYAIENADKIESIRIICGLGNFNTPGIQTIFSKPSLFALRLLPYISGRLIQKILSAGPSKKRTIGRRNFILAFFLPASRPDLELFKRPHVALALNLALTEALKQNSLGPKQDARAF